VHIRRVAFGALVAVAIACSGEGGAGDGGAAAKGATTTSSAAASASTTATTAGTTTTPTAAPRGRRGSGQPVTFAFAGDVNFEGRMRDRLFADPSTALREVAPTLSAADIAMVNLETAITEGGTPEAKDFTFRAPASALDALRAAGVDVTTMANNHGMDFGAAGLQDSLAARAEKGFPVLGIGQNQDEAFAPFRTEVNGQRIAIIAATQVLDDSLITAWTATPDHPGLASAKLVDRLVAEVTKARADSDTVVVFLHWGIERMTCPSTNQQDLAVALAAAGADIIVGSHAHRVLAGGRLGTSLVDYGLGNFAFYAGSAEGAETGILTVTATGRDIDSYAWLPGRISDRVPSLLTGADADAGLAHWDSLRPCSLLFP
jgi:poly-gamma-glutamate synthesis protein (capsule biosynthesis protein)